MALVAVLAASAPAAISYSTDFTAADGFAAGELRWQNGWLGQTGYIVDPTGTGTVTYPSDGNYRRTLYGEGGLGGTGGTPAGGSSSVGDVIEFTAVYQLSFDGARTNAGPATIGYRDEFSTTYNAAPKQGVKIEYNQWQDSTGGSVKFFPDMADTDNSDAMILDGTDLGFGVYDPCDPGAWDGVSDTMQISYQATYQGAGNWQVDSLTVENLATTTVYTYSGATQTYAADYGDYFFAWKFADAGAGVLTGTADAMSYDYVPEAATLAIFGLGAMLLRRNK